MCSVAMWRRQNARALRGVGKAGREALRRVGFGGHELRQRRLDRRCPNPKAYLAVCGIFKDEAPYLAEWIAFHQAVGVDPFFLYDNASTDEWRRVLAPALARGDVEVIPWPQPP